MIRKSPPLECAAEGYLRVAVCQVETHPWDLTGNLERTMAALEEAADQHAELAVTPECVLSGYSPMHDAPTRERTAQVAVELKSHPISAVASLAARRNMAITLGFAEKDPVTGFIHNTALLIGNDGIHLAHYRKVHCRDFEDAAHTGLFKPGDRFVAGEITNTARERTETLSFRIGLMICFDREIPESVRCLRAMGSQLIVCPLATDTASFNCNPGLEINNEFLTRCRAAENEVFIAVVNHSGAFNGGSYIVGPAGELLLQLGPEPCVKVVNLPVAAIAKFHSNPLGWLGWGYRRPDVYQRHLG